MMFRNGLPVKTQPNRHETLQASITVPLLSLSLLQDVLRPGDIDLPAEHPEARSNDASVLSATHISVRDVSLSTVIVQQFLLEDELGPSEDKDKPITSVAQVRRVPTQFETPSGLPIRIRIAQKTVTAGIGPSSLAVTHASPEEGQQTSPIRRNPIPATGDGTVLEMQLDGIQLKAEMPDEKQSISVTVKDISLRFVDSAAEMVTGIVHSWIIVSRTIEDAVVRAHYRPVQYYRRLVSDILQAAHREQINTDPLFLNRPTAAAVQLRSGTSWKVLAHVRHIMRRLSSESTLHIRDTFTQHIDAKSDFHAIVSHLQEWHNWELDEPVIRRLALIRLLFLPEELQKTLKTPASENAEERNFTMPLTTNVQILLESRRLRVSYYEDGMCTNSLALEPCQVLGSQMTTQDPAAMLRVSIGNLSVSLDPGILRLVLHVSRVRTAFEKKLARLLHRPGSASEERAGNSSGQARSIPLHATVLTGIIEVSAWASGVKVHTALQAVHLHSSLDLSINQAASVTCVDGSIYAACDTAKLTASIAEKPVHHERPLAGKSTLFTVQIDAANGHVVLQSKTSHTSETHILVTSTMGGVRIRVPRSVLRMTRL